MPPKRLDRERIRHLVTMVLLALAGPDDASIRAAIAALAAESKRSHP